MLRKFKKNIDDHNLTDEELKQIENRIYELKDLIIICVNKIKNNPNDKQASIELKKYTEEFSDLKKKLKKANKYAKIREQHIN